MLSVYSLILGFVVWVSAYYYWKANDPPENQVYMGSLAFLARSCISAPPPPGVHFTACLCAMVQEGQEVSSAFDIAATSVSCCHTHIRHALHSLMVNLCPSLGLHPLAGVGFASP